LFLALGYIFQGKNCPMIWAKFYWNKIGWGIVQAIFVVTLTFVERVPSQRPGYDFYELPQVCS
jgi:hypothetical protein